MYSKIFFNDLEFDPVTNDPFKDSNSMKSFLVLDFQGFNVDNNELYKKVLKKSEKIVLNHFLLILENESKRGNYKMSTSMD
jgi:hypothetical protein